MSAANSTATRMPASLSLSVSMSMSLSLSVADSALAGPRRPRRSRWRARLAGWRAVRRRAQLASQERALLARAQVAPGARVLSLGGLGGILSTGLARLRGTADGSVDLVVTVAALADADDVMEVLAQVQRVLRPGGRLLFVEPVVARAGTRLRRAQRLWRWLWPVIAGAVHPPRDLWNDLKAARFQRLSLEHLNLVSLGVPVPYIMGEAVVGESRSPRTRRPEGAALASSPRSGVDRTPALGEAERAFAFFGGY